MYKLLNITAASFLIIFSAVSASFSGEFPIISDSTVIGTNFGYPSGTPETGHTKAGNLDFVFETTFFAKNLELTNLETIDGQTFIGYLAPLRLRYRPHDKVTLEAGALLGHNFGDENRLDEMEPIFRLVYEPKDNLYIIAGTIMRTHPLHDAIFDDVRAFRRNVEQGFQFRSDLKWFKEDLWINWKVREDEMTSEQFEIGSATQLRFDNLWLDGQFLWVHTGGQKNLESVVSHNINFVAGASYGFQPEFKSSLLSPVKDIRIGGHYIYTSDTPDESSAEPKTTGSGFEGRVTADIKPSKETTLHLFGSYYKGSKLLAREGDPLYSMDEYAQIGTNLFFNLPAGLRLELGIAVQVVEGTFEHTEQLYLTWGKSFTLKDKI